ncbi:hypothetical protein MRB53_002464 [Persea americana]|uniref:Uncharacterized protein n=1 Tax=Persea americana TaxID=3435 RepID=A0ACC2MUT2_PERAE|nr:hypothetical protein MRB53_002464 [Persea americana]
MMMVESKMGCDQREIGVEETDSLVMASPTQVVLEHIKEVPVPEEFSTSQVEAEGNSHDTIVSEMPVVPEPSTAMHGVGVATDDITQALALQA